MFDKILCFETQIILRFMPTASAAAMCYYAVHLEWAINSIFMLHRLFNLKSLLRCSVYKT